MRGLCVYATSKTFEWYTGTDAYEAYHCPYSSLETNENYHILVQLELMRRMGVPVRGVIGREGSEPLTYWVDWVAGGLHYGGYFELESSQITEAVQEFLSPRDAYMVY